MATLLPTGEVFVSGGTTTTRDADALMQAEMYDPRVNQWRVLPAMTRVRNYHSTALLMPNGAVWHSGSNVNCDPGPQGRDRTVEIYEPWYFCGPRPVITGVTSRACAGERLNIETPQAGKINEVVLVRCGSFTHAFNPDQRLVSVPFERSKNTSNLLIATLPDNSAVLIPGYYLVFILTKDHVPSEGRFVHICRGRIKSRVRPDVSWWRRVAKLLDQLREDPEQLDRLELILDEPFTVGHLRRLEELEAAVRAIEEKITGGKPGDGGPAPPVGGGVEHPVGGGHPHGGGGHRHGGERPHGEGEHPHAGGPQVDGEQGPDTGRAPRQAARPRAGGKRRARGRGRKHPRGGGGHHGDDH